MTEQVEKVARAICCHKNGVFSGCSAKFDNSPFTVCQAHTFMDDARAAISATPLDDSVARIVALEGALRPFAKLQLPQNPSYNAGAYSIFHKDIKQARAVLGETSSTEGRG